MSKESIRKYRPYMLLGGLALTIVLAFAFSCSKKSAPAQQEPQVRVEYVQVPAPSQEDNTPKGPVIDKDIVVLYTNDVHCGIEDNIGYAGLSACKEDMLNVTPYVALVDCGDAIQGAAVGTISKGEYIIRIMNKLGYDYAIFGNHEFDYGVDRLSQLLQMAKFQYLGANVHYVGHYETKFPTLKPYAIKDFDGVKVAFIGVTTPESIVKSTPRYFMEDYQGQRLYAYSFDSGEKLYETTQKYIDEVRNEHGANYVVVLAHLGLEDDSAPNRGTDLIANTSGIDAFLDGHSHSTVEYQLVKDKAGKDVVYSQTGTKLQNIGVLTITPNGKVRTRLIKDATTGKSMENFIKGIKDEYEAHLNSVVGASQIDLMSKRADGTRAVRNRETLIGDFCADAYRYVAQSDIALVNGGGIRGDIRKGDITYNNLITIHPYGNMLCSVRTSGQRILDALEHGCRNLMHEASDGTNAIGENGGFLQVSGLRFDVDTSIPSPVKVDDKGFVRSISGPRRVKNVMVEKNGEWVPLSAQAKYTVASHNYLLLDQGDGYTMFSNEELVIDKAMIDNQVLMTYLNEALRGEIKASDYSESNMNRIYIY